MVECSIPRYRLVVSSDTTGYMYSIVDGTMAMRIVRGFSDYDSAKLFGQRAIYCLNLDTIQASK
jgi:hypothetical protein